MPRFEVFIPAADTNSFNVTFRVDSDNWMAALKTGMTKLGEQGASVQNILVDIQDDNSVHVTESASGRVFRIRELTDAEVAQGQVKKGSSTGHPVAPAREPPPPPAAPAEHKTLLSVPSFADHPSARQPEPLAGTVAPDRARTPIETPALGEASMPRPAEYAETLPLPGPLPNLQETKPLPQQPRAADQAAPEPAPAPMIPPGAVAAIPSFPSSPPLVAHEPSLGHSGAGEALFANAAFARSQPAIRQTGTHPAGAPKRKSLHVEAKQIEELEAPTSPIVGKIGRAPNKRHKEEIEDLLAEVFERVQEVYAQKDANAALYFLLDLALEKIPAESGSIFNADATSGDLSFRAVRGPKAQELLSAKLVIPAGTGVAGFCAVEGVSLALSDVQKDPRYYAAVAEKVKYTPKSILCAPIMTHGRTFGCLQILNRTENSKFNETEVGLASYIAHQAAMYLNSR